MSQFKVRRHTTVTLEHEGHIFPIPFNGEFYQERVHISENQLKAVIGVLVVDDSPEDPFDGDEGEFYQFNSRYIHYKSRPELDDFKRIIRQNPGRVVTHSGTDDNHGPGTCRCRVNDGPFTVADTKKTKREHFYNQDNGASAPRFIPAEQALDNAYGYYIVPEDATDPAQYAAGALASYTAYCNGEVYGVCVWTYERASIDDEWSEPDRDAECWGFIGSEYAEGELEDEFSYAQQKVDLIDAQTRLNNWLANH